MVTLKKTFRSFLHFENPLKILIFYIGGLSLLEALFNSLNSPWPDTSLFALTTQGMSKGFYWQFITSIFIIPYQGFIGGFFLHLSFNIFLFWQLGKALIAWKKRPSFYVLLISIGLLSSLIAWTGSCFFSLTKPYYGNTNLLAGLLFAYVILHPSEEIY